ncbi:MAG TPA: thiamine pyrophosphate-dependent enzyme [Gemmatales bacterium]|nr:thiamine pyrophosphate-dependent enzyme [Gemmatales bacterium]
MQLDDVLEVVAAHRGNHVVMATMSAIGAWPRFSDTPLDFCYLPSSMGLGPSLALGMALAQDRHGVIVLAGDGSTLMHLGALATLAAYPAAVYLVVLNNGIYEVTGGQRTVGSMAVNFVQAAQAMGFRRTCRFADKAAWQSGAAAALSGPGPVLIELPIEPRFGQKTPRPPRPMAEQLVRLRAALAS